MWQQTKWFNLSGRELRTLAIAAGIVMVALIVLEVARSMMWEADVTVEGVRETLPHAPLLNVNTAQDYELCLLPGIGEKTARAIVEYRGKHGPFKSLDELRHVSGIGPKTVETLREHLMCVPVKNQEPPKKSAAP
jgi:competence protein ComEA